MTLLLAIALCAGTFVFTLNVLGTLYDYDPLGCVLRKAAIFARCCRKNALKAILATINWCFKQQLHPDFTKERETLSPRLKRIILENVEKRIANEKEARAKAFFYAKHEKGEEYLRMPIGDEIAMRHQADSINHGLSITSDWIIAAAIRKEGMIFHRTRHHMIIRAHAPKFFNGCEQGFLDGNGKFLNRADALIQAVKTGQIERSNFNSTDLFSEDLW